VRYFHNSELSTIVLHGSLGEVQSILVIITTFVKIGHGLKKFSALHSLKEKGFVIFKVESEKNKHPCKSSL